ncbi:MAG: ATP-binding cassette domain-containing protein [Rhodocyclaceae bacterium]|nr:ATP-binding cassette domain-containing protein [Rhodocyclaceae bacterium]MCA3075961.1 ATP-binding cassette domain-containing protein [Rhodocyclaceae bacterium]MCA3091960.1 ATP-binding cassette domain-containing protein [Rhodocyclaceae bacterium]MCA3095133.1 ATP-binding cassette domain-containing protein [Rhodocyclaceae bacterium]MCA3096522.1 ATP-binding cassette domain-containing protein [Rhodocyclaceae bacterium]
MIELDQVGKRYHASRGGDGHDALKSITLSIDSGEFAVVTGHSGAGKSTLLKLIAGIELPTTGTVRVNGQDLAGSRRALPFIRRRIGLIFQDHKLLYDRTVFDNVQLPLDVTGFPPREAARRVRAALDKVGLLSRERERPVTLSGGEQQRLCIARAIVHRPSLLLADEPTANLDMDYAQDIVEILRSFHQVGVTVVVSTHDLVSLRTAHPRVIALSRGMLASENAP